MTKEEVVNKTAEYVKATLENEGSGHDWVHVENVWNLAKEIALSEFGADMFVVELAALLHDIADWKDNNGSLENGVKLAGDWLAKCEVDMGTIIKVTTIMGCVSSLVIKTTEKSMTLEGFILRDADRLEMMSEKSASERLLLLEEGLYTKRAKEIGQSNNEKYV